MAERTEQNRTEQNRTEQNYHITNKLSKCKRFFTFAIKDFGFYITIKFLGKNYRIKREIPPENYEQALAIWFKRKTGENLDLKNPKTYNEKIQWLKLYDSTPIKTQLADKYAVRDFVKEKIGEKYLIPLLGVWENANDIDFDQLPERFVLKCNHGCGYNIIVKDKTKLNKRKILKKLNKWMNEDFSGVNGLELHYKNIPRKIIAEEYIGNGIDEIVDYKLWCFNGKCHYIQHLTDRSVGLKMAFFDNDWNKLDFDPVNVTNNSTIEKPSHLDNMIELAEILSKEFNHVRVDFYLTPSNEIKFGEMTFTPASGTRKWKTHELNIKVGDLLNLPVKE